MLKPSTLDKTSPIRELQNAINGIKDQMKLLVDKMNNLNTAKETITGEGGSFDEE